MFSVSYVGPMVRYAYFTITLAYALNWGDNGVSHDTSSSHSCQQMNTRQQMTTTTRHSQMPSSSSKTLWQEQLKVFSSEASVVGLRYVANPSASVFRRSVWVLLLLAGAAFTTFQIQNRIRYFLSRPVSVNIRVEYVQQMRFPSVTICNENILTSSGASSLGKLSQTSSTS